MARHMIVGNASGARRYAVSASSSDARKRPVSPSITWWPPRIIGSLPDFASAVRYAASACSHSPRARSTFANAACALATSASIERAALASRSASLRSASPTEPCDTSTSRAAARAASARANVGSSASASS